MSLLRGPLKKILTWTLMTTCFEYNDRNKQFTNIIQFEGYEVRIFHLLFYMSTILQELTNTPRVTLAQLIESSRLNKTSKLVNINGRSRIENATQTPIEVKEPFYIDRFKVVDPHHHTHGDSDGKCMACQYAKLQSLTLSKRSAILRTGRETKLQGLRVKTQRPSESASFNIKQILNRKFRPSQDTSKADMKYLAEYLKYKMCRIDKAMRQSFEQQVGKGVDDPSVIRFYVNFLMSRERRFNNNKLTISQIVKNVENMKSNRFETLLVDKELLKQLKHQIKREEASYRNLNHKMQIIPPSMTDLIKTSKNDVDSCSLKLIHKNKERDREKKDRGGAGSKTRSKKNAKKVRIDVSMSDDSCNDLPQQICSKYLIEENASIELSEQVKNQLNLLARRKYRHFKGAVDSIDDFLQDKIFGNPHIHEKVTKRLEAATDWMKSCIPNDDNYEEQKHNELSKLMSSVKNLNKLSNRRSSLKKNSKELVGYGASKFNEGKQGEQKLSRRSSSKSRRSRFSKGERKSSKDVDYNLEGDDDSMEAASKRSILLERSERQIRQPRKYLQENTEKLIMQEMNDKVLNESQLKIEKEGTGKKSEIKNRISKASILKYDKSRQLDDFEHLTPKQNQVSPPAVLQKKPPILGINKLQKTAGIRERAEASLKQLVKQDESEAHPVQKQRKKKVYLKIKAAELLKQNNELITGVENQLRQLKLSKFIINSTDCVFTRKKKIRNIRQMIKMKPYCDIEEEAINRILQYVEIYEENCQILLQKYLEHQKQVENSSKSSYGFCMDRKQVFKELLFYDLKNDFKFGLADEEELQFTFKTDHPTNEWQISSKNIKLQTIVPIQIKCNGSPEKFSDLVQVEVSQVGSRESFGIIKSAIRQSYQDWMHRSSSNTSRAVSNMYLTNA